MLARSRILAGLAVLMIVLAVTATAEERIDWRENFESSVEEAVLLRRPVLVTFYTDWCGWCRKLEAQTFRDQEFVKTSARYVPVRLNGDRDRGLAAMYRVTSYPTTILLNRRGKELGRVVGYKPPIPFTQALLAGMGAREDYEATQALVRENPDDPEAVYSMGDVFMALGRYVEAAESFRTVLQLDPDNASQLVDDAQLDLAVAVYLGTDAPSSLPKFQAYLDRFPNSDRRDQGLYFYGLALRDAGETAASDDRLAEAVAVTDLDYIRSQVNRIMGGE